MASETPTLGSLNEITMDTAQAVAEPPEWEELTMVVDSGASVTVINNDMVLAVKATEAKPNVRYEVADGSLIENMGQKTFSAFTDCGVLRKMTAEVTDVSKALLIKRRHSCQRRQSRSVRAR